jgi:hypothetical protein
MGETLTAEQVRNEAVAAMGSELGEVYHSLSDQVAWLHLKWDTFCELFAERDIVDLLNSAAPAYFHELQRETWEDVLLHLCRVTDPPLSAGKSNLTLRRLRDLVSDQMLRTNIQALVDDAVKKNIVRSRLAQPAIGAHRTQSLAAVGLSLAQTCRGCYGRYSTRGQSSRTALSKQNGFVRRYNS